MYYWIIVSAVDIVCSAISVINWLIIEDVALFILFVAVVVNDDDGDDDDQWRSQGGGGIGQLPST